MTIEARLADGRVLKFPDGTDPSIIQATVKKQMGIQQQPQELSFVPTDEALARERAPKKEQPGFIDTAKGIGEAALTAVTGATTGALGFGLGTLEGAVGELTGRLQPGEGQQKAQQFAQALTFEPRTEAGRGIVKDIGEVLGTLPPTIVPGAIPVAGAIPFAGKLAKNKLFGKAAKTRAILADEIISNNRNAGNIAKALDVDGKLIKNPNVKTAIKLMGDGEEAYSTAINFERMNNETRSQVNKMLDIIRDNKRSGAPEDIMNNRPAQVVGDSIAKRIRRLDDIKKKASGDIGKVVSGPIGNRPVKVVTARNKFIKSLQESDISVSVSEQGRLVADTSRTLTNINEVVKIDKLNNILDRLQSGKMTAKEAHKIKRNIRELVDFDPAAPGAIKVSAEIENTIKQLASDLGDSISVISPKYKKANVVFSEIIGVLKEADKLLGGTLLIGDELASTKFGSLAKRVGTNLASRERVISLLTTVDDALAKRGVKEFNDNIFQQVATLADLEKIFKVESAQAPFGFQARIAQGAGEAAITGGAPTREVLRGALDKFRDMSKLDFDDRMKALRALSKPKRVTTE